ncbi:MAG: PAS domain S-box protein, partial [Dehalococcoidales bacterium]|nr:PAS domain S-box protein [Dehalococcoidales bacterium]
MKWFANLGVGKKLAMSYARNLIEASLDPLVTISPEGKVTDVNKATEQVTGLTRDKLIGTDFSSYFTEPDKADAGYKKVLSQGSVKDYPLTLRHVS